MNLKIKSGLSIATINQINSVFEKSPKIKKVYLYGSRAKGNFRHGSDIDLVIKNTNLTFNELLHIETELDDLMLPYSFDVSLFQKLTNQKLIEHINRVGLLFYSVSE